MLAVFLFALMTVILFGLGVYCLVSGHDKPSWTADDWLLHWHSMTRGQRQMTALVLLALAPMMAVLTLLCVLLLMLGAGPR